MGADGDSVGGVGLVGEEDGDTVASGEVGGADPLSPFHLME